MRAASLNVLQFCFCVCEVVFFLLFFLFFLLFFYFIFLFCFVLGITRDGLHKRRATGAKRTSMHKKRKFALGRPAAMTRIGELRVHPVRARGGLIKQRAIRLETGNFSWGSEAISKKTRIVEVLYNASNNELVRTNTLVKGAIVAIDSAPFVDWSDVVFFCVFFFLNSLVSQVQGLLWCGFGQDKGCCSRSCRHFDC